MENVTYFTKPLLKKVNTQSIKADRNRTIIPEVIDELDEDTLFPVVFAMPHNDIEMRIKVMLAPETSAFLDVSFEAYEALPTTNLTTVIH